jgi:hypothetical protein
MSSCPIVVSASQIEGQQRSSPALRRSEFIFTQARTALVWVTASAEN